MATTNPETKKTRTASQRSGFGITLVLLTVALLILFSRSFDPTLVQFSNDGPYGAVAAADGALPAAITGCWQDLNSVGTPVPAPGPNITTAFRWAIPSPELFSRFFCPFVLLVLGVCAWFGFRFLGLSPVARCLGSLATMLNSAYFSTGCWGIGTVVIAIGANLIAVGLASSPRFRQRWSTYILAGFAVGLGVMEGFDVGALYSVCLAALVAYLAVMDRVCPSAAVSSSSAKGENPNTTHRPSAVTAIFKGAARVAIIAVCAGIVAAHSLTTLITTQIRGVANVGEETMSKEQRWAFATQWSLPKREALGILIPGLFGFRDRPAPRDGTDYWGLIGSDLSWDSYFAGGKQGPPPQAMARLSGGGPYAGVLVVLVAVWTALQSFRKRDSAFTLDERKLIWFWTAAFCIALLLAFGRFAPFYKFIFALPYSSTVRNPAKFLHILTLSIVMLFAIGVNGLFRCYLTGTVSKDNRVKEPVGWIPKSGFNRKWIVGCFVLIGLSLIGWLIYSASRDTLIAYIQLVGFPNPELAASIAAFSIHQVGWYIVVLLVSAGVLTAILGGAFRGSRAGWGAVLVGAVMCLDLVIAARPWVAYWDRADKYMTTPVLEQLRQQPYEGRVAIMPAWLQQALQLPPDLQQVESVLQAVYHNEWKQHQFQLFNIQALDVVQMSRKPADLEGFDRAMFPRTLGELRLVGRQWELTSTRYVLGSVFWERDVLNQAIDPQHRFQIVERFSVVLKPGRTGYTDPEDLTAVLNTNGNYALYEFRGALPKAKLYADWQIQTNAETLLQELTSPAFNPAQTVLLMEPVPDKPSISSTNREAGSVEFASYAPKKIVLRAKAESACVLLLNDKYDSNWQVSVDGKPEKLLRANYLMRGVYLTPGEHNVTFQFKPSTAPLYVSLAAIGLNLAFLGYVIVSGKRRRDIPP